MEEPESITNESLDIDVSTRQLRAFATVATTHSYSHAAEMLHYTEQGVYAQVKQLERLVGCRLMARSGREVRLTDEGSALLPACRLMLADLERFARIRCRMGERRCITMAVSAVAGAYLLPPLIRLFARDHTQVAVELLACPVEQVSDLVTDGAADIGVSEDIDRLTLPGDVSRFDWVDEPASLFMASESLSPSSLPAVVYTILRSPELLAMRSRQLEERGLSEPELRSLPSVEAVKGASSAGLGYCLLPRCAALLELHAKQLREVEGFSGLFGGPVSICIPQDDRFTPEARAFHQFLLANAALPRVFLTLN